ncbi:hypothetical protein [Vampirovibrio chlorellavorus]|uniref:hypothetical protein n=1 Tax=Vampirovibrio chlorellavorus TaxID=758823 RepID=UPI0026EE0DCC|nr:hypothetical protein [Vampirovibrio chlorellavorus]
MRIESGAQSLQMLKAQQAWEARRASKPQTPASEFPASRIELETPPAPAALPSQPISPQWQRTVNDIQNIAAKAGFVGVTEQDIRRAYQQGESLLADYRV